MQAIVSEYNDIFTNDIMEIQHSPASIQVSHTIDTQVSKPVRQKPYRLSHYEMEFLHQEVEKLLALGVIKPTSSAWLSSVVLIKKKG